MGVQNTNPLPQLSLPPGFRFYPTDEELLVQYLCRKVAGQHFSLQIIGEVDLYKYDPWVLPSKATFGEKEWYFFSPRDRKYPNGSRPNRVAGSGYWKATGTDKVITTEGRRVGIKKALVFYVGKAPKGTKTNWIMHEYRLSEPSRKTGSTKLDEWVLCRIYKKNSSAEKPIAGIVSKEHSHGASSSSSSSHFDDVLDSLPEINDRLFSLPRMNSMKTFQQQDDKLNIQNITSGNFDWASLAGVGPVPELTAIGRSLPLTQGQVINANNVFNEMCVPSISPMGQLDEEVQSEIRTRKTNYPSSIYQNPPNYFSNGSVNSEDPFGSRFPGQLGRFDFRP